MTLIQEFKEKALSDVTQFEIQEDKWNYSFVKYSMGEAVYIYGEYAYDNRVISLDTKLELYAILSQGNIYMVNSYRFCREIEKNCPENVCDFSDEIKEVNNIIKNELFPIFYNNLPIRDLTEEQQSYVVSRVRKVILQDNSIVSDPSVEKVMSQEDVAKLLCGAITIEEHANEYFEKNKEKFITIKSQNNELKRLVDMKHNVEGWEIEMADSLRALDAKTVTVEFNCNGETGVEKVEKNTLLRMLNDNDYFSSYNFLNGKSGKELLKKLNVGDYSGHVNGTLRCKHISSIKYGKKVIYSVMQLT